MAAGLGLNAMVSWLSLPFLLPNTRAAGLHDYGEVLLWQAIGLVGWPLALLGGFLSLVIGSSTAGWRPLLVVLMYPAMLALFAYILRTGTRGVTPVIVLHVLVTASFVAVWYGILNGFDFMVG